MHTIQAPEATSTKCSSFLQTLKPITLRRKVLRKDNLGFALLNEYSEIKCLLYFGIYWEMLVFWILFFYPLNYWFSSSLNSAKYLTCNAMGYPFWRTEQSCRTVNYCLSWHFDNILPFSCFMLFQKLPFFFLGQCNWTQGIFNHNESFSMIGRTWINLVEEKGRKTKRWPTQNEHRHGARCDPRCSPLTTQ